MFFHLNEIYAFENYENLNNKKGKIILKKVFYDLSLWTVFVTMAKLKVLMINFRFKTYYLFLRKIVLDRVKFFYVEIDSRNEFFNLLDILKDILMNIFLILTKKC